MQRAETMKPGPKRKYGTILIRGMARNMRLYRNVFEESRSCREAMSCSCSCSSIASGKESSSEPEGYLKVRRRRAPDMSIVLFQQRFQETKYDKCSNLYIVKDLVIVFVGP